MCLPPSHGRLQCCQMYHHAALALLALLAAAAVTVMTTLIGTQRCAALHRDRTLAAAGVPMDGDGDGDGDGDADADADADGHGAVVSLLPRLSLPPNDTRLLGPAHRVLDARTQAGEAAGEVLRRRARRLEAVRRRLRPPKTQQIPRPSEGRVAVVKAHWPGGGRRARRMLVDIFLPAVAKADPDRHTVVVVVNGSDVLTPGERAALDRACLASGARALFREANRGMDFGAYSAALRALDGLRFDSYVFLNDSVAGPLHPICPSAPFADLLRLLDAGADLAGQSINVLVSRSGDRPQPHVQSMAFALSERGLQAARNDFLSLRDDENPSYEELVGGHEIGMSARMLESGLRIDCLLPTLRDIDWAAVGDKDARVLAPNLAWGGDPWNANAWFGRTLQPSETLLYKWNRVRSLDLELVLEGARAE